MEWRRAPPELSGSGMGETPGTTRAPWARRTDSIFAVWATMADAKCPLVMVSGATEGRGGDDGGWRSGVYDADRRVGQRARHGGDAVAARHVGPHEAPETDDDVRQPRRRVEGPTPSTRGADSRRLERGHPQTRATAPWSDRVVDDGASHRIMMRLRRADGLNDAVDDEIDIEVLACRGGVVVSLQKGGQTPA